MSAYETLIAVLLVLLAVVGVALFFHGRAGEPRYELPLPLEPQRRSINFEVVRGTAVQTRVELFELTVQELEQVKLAGNMDVAVVAAASRLEPMIVAEHFYPSEVQAMAQAVMELTFAVELEGAEA